MGRLKVKQRIQKRWQEQSLREKIHFLLGLVFLIFLMSAFIDLWTIKISMLDFRYSLSSNEIVGNLVQSMETEAESFESYVKGEITAEEFARIAAQTDQAVEELPFDYERLGEERYAWTLTIKKAYSVYRGKCDSFLAYGENNTLYIKEAYQLYDMEDYLISYSNTLMTLTTEALNSFYQQRFPDLVLFTVLILIITALLFVGIAQTSHLLNKTLTEPVVKLVDASKEIAKNNYDFEDISVSNKDEIGELVHAFNKMKYATGKYITTLEENREALDKLHAEELQKQELETQMEKMKLEVLRNQVNPHFLFNTLNVISGMASLEDAQVTEKMIKALSSLFRYNLRTNEKESLLEQEVQVINDYMYLQKMRFGERLQFEVDCDEALYNVYVPSFILQPIVENSVVHGLASKEEGGLIKVNISKDENNRLHISVSDTGVGMTEEELAVLQEKMKREDDIHRGIGVGNIYRRLKIMYQDSSFEMSSIKGQGTRTEIELPLKTELEDE